MLMEEAARYRLPKEPLKTFRYLNSSGCTAIEGVDDKADFQEVRQAMLAVNIDEEAQVNLMRKHAWAREAWTFFSMSWNGGSLWLFQSLSCNMWANHQSHTRTKLLLMVVSTLDAVLVRVCALYAEILTPLDKNRICTLTELGLKGVGKAV